MGEAFDLVQKALPEKSAEDIAACIVNFARAGVNDAPVLAAKVLDFFALASMPSPSKGSSPFS
jgi:hypothetical protein